jgi:hypothetical protein
MRKAQHQAELDAAAAAVERKKHDEAVHAKVEPIFQWLTRWRTHTQTARGTHWPSLYPCPTSYTLYAAIWPSPAGVWLVGHCARRVQAVHAPCHATYDMQPPAAALQALTAAPLTVHLTSQDMGNDAFKHHDWYTASHLVLMCLHVPCAMCAEGLTSVITCHLARCTTLEAVYHVRRCALHKTFHAPTACDMPHATRRATCNTPQPHGYGARCAKDAVTAAMCYCSSAIPTAFALWFAADVAFCMLLCRCRLSYSGPLPYGSTLTQST